MKNSRLLILLIVQLGTGSLAYAEGGDYVDVTSAVAAKVANNSLEFNPGLSDLGVGTDPAPLIKKKLKVDYTIGGETKSKTVIEDTPFVLKAPVGKTLAVTHADYGDIAVPLVDVTEILKAAVQSDHLSLTVTPKEVSAGCDPVPMVKKQLTVEYSLSGKTSTVTASDGEKLDLPPAGSAKGPLVIKSAIYGKSS